jgi:uncharacterized RDD family membrane protein YckC
MQVLSVNNDYATGMRRLGAFIVDRLLIGVLIKLLFFNWWGTWFDFDRDIFTINLHFAQYHIIREAIMILYYSFMESSQYQGTLGKIAAGIKVVNKNGQRITFSQALLRNLSKIISKMVLYIGYIMIIFDDRKQGLHDKIADTFVVKQ